MSLPLSRRRELVQQDQIPVTLDGVPAVIAGIRDMFATVAALPDGPAVEVSWPTVERVLWSGGRFRS
jgi:hypothetical protein